MGFLMGIVCVSPMVLFAASQPAMPNKAPIDSVDEMDSTDTYAIPLDTSEEEENLEEKSLERMQKKIQQKATAPTAQKNAGNTQK